LPVNIRLRWRRITATNTLPYLGSELITAVRGIPSIISSVIINSILTSLLFFLLIFSIPRSGNHFIPTLLIRISFSLFPNLLDSRPVEKDVSHDLETSTPSLLKELELGRRTFDQVKHVFATTLCTIPQKSPH